MANDPGNHHGPAADGFRRETKRYLSGLGSARVTGNKQRRERDYAGQYEYLVLSVSGSQSLPQARQTLTDHAEYGKWELQRSRIYSGGGRKFWLRRKVLRVERTA